MTNYNIVAQREEYNKSKAVKNANSIVLTEIDLGLPYSHIKYYTFKPVELAKKKSISLSQNIYSSTNYQVILKRFSKEKLENQHEIVKYCSNFLFNSYLFDRNKKTDTRIKICKSIPTKSTKACILENLRPQQVLFFSYSVSKQTTRFPQQLTINCQHDNTESSILQKFYFYRYMYTRRINKNTVCGIVPETIKNSQKKDY